MAAAPAELFFGLEHSMELSINYQVLQYSTKPKLTSGMAGSRHALRRRADGNVAAVSHGQHVPTPIAAAA